MSSTRHTKKSQVAHPWRTLFHLFMVLYLRWYGVKTKGDTVVSWPRRVS